MFLSKTKLHVFMFRSELKEKNFYTTFTIKNVNYVVNISFAWNHFFLLKLLWSFFFFTNPIKTLARTKSEAESITIHNNKKLFPDVANQNNFFCSCLVMGKPGLFSKIRFTTIFTVSWSGMEVNKLQTSIFQLDI